MSLTSLVAIGPWQIIIIVVVILFLFGGKRISEFMGGFGKGIKEFKKELKEDDEKKEDSSSK
ncbi:MAG: twin-arginine translocase TatA/TatE family subunit [Flavobacteriaceae bacterium]|jgi:sec-independent protein translocase protein TatA|tara:strand:+ start:25 stop:210 length:186 start_codon:yes stop_codon:yes gene_type:complete